MGDGLLAILIADGGRYAFAAASCRGTRGAWQYPSPGLQSNGLATADAPFSLALHVGEVFMAMPWRRPPTRLHG